MRRSFPVGALLGALVWVCCSWSAGAGDPTAPTAAPEGSRPTLWRVLRGDGSVAYHLLGSVHLGRSSMLRFPEAVEQAWSRADELVLEVRTDELGAVESLRLVQRHARIDPPETLRDRVSADTLAGLERYFAATGAGLEPLLQLQPWFVGVQIEMIEAMKAGLDPAHGVDLHFAARAEGSKEVVGLETAELQMQLLSGLPADVQELLLRDALERAQEEGSGIEALVSAWQRGDDEELERIVYKSMSGELPRLTVFYDQLLFGRNETMAQRLAGMARDGKQRFVVVGAGHLVGERGIPVLLRDYGLRVEEVEPR